MSLQAGNQYEQPAGVDAVASAVRVASGNSAALRVFGDKVNVLVDVTAMSNGLLTTPTGLTAAAVAGGGTFAAGTYFWKITATNANGETLASNEASVAIALNGRATLNWTAVPGATGYRVYRATATNGQSVSPAFVAAVGAVTTYTDTGTATSAGAVPASNTTAGTAPSLALSLEWALDGVTWFPADPVDTLGVAFTAAGRRVRQVDVKALFCRVVWAITGSTPSTTFAVHLHGLDY